MGVTDRTLKIIKERRQNLLNGNINSISSPFKRFSNDFLGIEQGKYYIVTASTKGGKTQLSSYLFFFYPLLYAYNHPNKINLKIFYYPLEETPEKITERFMSFLLYELSSGDIRISPEDLRSSDNSKPLPENILQYMETEEFKKILDFFEKTVWFSESTNPTGMYKECREYALDTGKVYNKKVQVKNKETGETKEVEAFDYYEQANPKEYRIIFWDHISLTTTERSMNLYETISKLTQYFVILKNKYKFIPVVIQQQAFFEGFEAMKLNKLEPSLVNLTDNKATGRDCEVALGIFSPARFNLDSYMGYDILKFKDNIRFLKVLASRDGEQNGMIALLFDGATCHFRELPLPTETEKLEEVYKYLKSIRIKSNSIMMLFSKRNNLIKNIINKLKEWVN